MKILRILTGIHAGAQLRLSARSYRLGADDDADIRIGDCGATGATLLLDDRDNVTIVETPVASEQAEHNAPHGGAARDDCEPDSNERADESTQGPLQTPVLLPDFTPFKLGDIAICVGDAAAQWPIDIELLDMLLTGRGRKTAVANGPRRHRIALYAAACGFAFLVTATLILLFSSGSGEAAQARDVRALAQRTATALAEAGLSELSVNVRGPVVTVTGMVRTPGDDATARAVIRRLGKNSRPIEQRYDVAANIVQDIEEGANMRGAHAQYLGNGVFSVTGTVDDLVRARDALARLGPDFDSNVRRIDNRLTQSADTGPATPYSEVISNGNVKFLQSPDGTKHLYSVK